MFFAGVWIFPLVTILGIANKSLFDRFLGIDTKPKSHFVAIRSTALTIRTLSWICIFFFPEG